MQIKMNSDKLRCRFLLRAIEFRRIDADMKHADTQTDAMPTACLMHFEQIMNIDPLPTWFQSLPAIIPVEIPAVVGASRPRETWESLQSIV
jgi:hypothetical protein